MRQKTENREQENMTPATEKQRQIGKLRIKNKKTEKKTENKKT